MKYYLEKIRIISLVGIINKLIINKLIFLYKMLLKREKLIHSTTQTIPTISITPRRKAMIKNLYKEEEAEPEKKNQIKFPSI